MPEELKVLVVGTEVYFIEVQSHDPFNAMTLRKSNFRQIPMQKHLKCIIVALNNKKIPAALIWRGFFLFSRCLVISLFCGNVKKNLYNNGKN